jgi:hypothetical protein
LALSLGKNLLARGAFQAFDIRLVDIELQQQLPRLAGGFQHHRKPFPLRQPGVELPESEPVDPFRQIVSVVFGYAFAFIAGGQSGIKEGAGGSAADFSRNGVEDIEQTLKNRQRIFS